MNYIKQLDGIRAIAVMLVIIAHWMPQDSLLYRYGDLFNGVDIFFVLSGFLITRILLENRRQAERSGSGKGQLLKVFFIRRVLRIFPAYYAALLLLFLIGPIWNTGIRDNWGYFVSYTANFYFVKRQAWDGMLSHLWSLSVEEQFYLLWPWLMLLPGKRTPLCIILTFILLGEAAQYYFWNAPMGDIRTISCFDGLGMGALLAYAAVEKPAWLKQAYPYASVLALLCFLLQMARITGNSFFIPSRTLTAVCTVWLITAILLYEGRRVIFFDFILGNPALVFMGKISYGIYLYHNFLPYLTGGLLRYFNAKFLGETYPALYVLHFENFCLLLLTSYASWRLFEKPILKLKRGFDYISPLPKPQTAVAQP
ncbi:acyltransferase family protein [Tellurirhabdus rosea]|uniref:acyltransferase family protein n=1 Tax=Tellurirhabdus rosea TaxID=2674997 RepID=UPI002258CC1A|nr:acyltransferase [Tellurirhabdus rosea]